MREFSGLLSPYHGCSHNTFAKTYSKCEASSDYPLCYQLQVAKWDTNVLVLFNKAGPN